MLKLPEIPQKIHVYGFEPKFYSDKFEKQVCTLDHSLFNSNAETYGTQKIFYQKKQQKKIMQFFD